MSAAAGSLLVPFLLLTGCSSATNDGSLGSVSDISTEAGAEIEGGTNSTENLGSDSENGEDVDETTPPPGNPGTAEVEPAEIQLPNLIGMQESVATDLLFSLGVDDIDYIEQESLDREGTVLKQLPTPDALLRGGSVTLTYAVPLPPMPDFTGRRFGDAEAQLKEWGVSVLKEVEISTERPDGEVLSTVPDFGDKVGAEVLLVVSAAPIYGTLDTEDAPLVEQGREGAWFDQYTAQPAEIGGDLYEKSITASESANVTAGDLAYWEFNLGKDWQQLEATVGISDSSEFEQRARFRVILDGNVIWEQDDVKFGTGVPVRLDVSGGLRLRLESVALDQGRINMVWGSPRVVGVEGAPQAADD